MKKVLIIGYFWPYRNGSGRIIGLARYLSKFGWEPIILTGPLEKKPLPEFRVVETDFRCFLGSWTDIFGFNSKKDISDQFKEKLEDKPTKLKQILRRIYWLIQEIAAYPDENKGWKKFALKDAQELIEKEKIDAVISVWPVTSHIVAKELKEKYKIPWLADLPDLWSQNHDYHYSFLRRIFDRRIERKTLKSADALTTVTEPWADKLKKSYPNKKIYAISHGFDPALLNNKEAGLTQRFTITYTGQIYHKKQKPEKLLLALKNLVSKGILDANDIEVRFYGPLKDWLDDEIKNNFLGLIVRQYGLIPDGLSFESQKESQVLLLLNWENKEEKGVCPMKIFSYLASKRPILATGGSKGDVVDKILSATKAGVYAVSEEEIESCLKDWYLEYKKNGKVGFLGDIGEINKYSHAEMARRFVSILDGFSIDN
jgi:hypothetical protein